jgi:hypothetical protein
VRILVLRLERRGRILCAGSPVLVRCCAQLELQRPTVFHKPLWQSGLRCGLPIHFQTLHVGCVGSAPYAFTTTSPAARRMWIAVNSLRSTSSARPGISGYMPIADHTYHDDISPRSSLPGMPFGELVQMVFSTLRTASWVFHGCPRKSKSHGVSMEGSLFSSACRPPELRHRQAAIRVVKEGIQALARLLLPAQHREEALRVERHHP